MKQVSSTEARKRFFQLLDSAVQGEKVLIERKGIWLQLVPTRKKRAKKIPSYKALIHSAVDEADRWTWDWRPAKGLLSKTRKK